MAPPIDNPVPNPSTPSDLPAVARVVKRDPRPFYFCLGLVLGAAALGGFWWLLTTTRSQAQEREPTVRALVQVRKHEPTVLHHFGRQSQTNEADWENYKNTLVELVKSQQVLQSALGKVDAGEMAFFRNHEKDAAAWLRKNLQVGFIGNTEILRIGMTNGEPDDLVPVVNAVAEAFVEEVGQSERGQLNAKIDKLKELYKKYGRDIAKLRDDYRTTAENAGSSDPANLEFKERMALEALADKQRELRRLHLAAVDIQAQINIQKARKDTDKEVQAALKKLEMESALLKEKQKLLQKELTKENFVARKLTKQTVEVEGYHEAMAMAEEMIRKVGSELGEAEARKEAGDRVTLLEKAAVPQSK